MRFKKGQVFDRMTCINVWQQDMDTSHMNEASRIVITDPKNKHKHIIGRYLSPKGKLLAKGIIYPSFMEEIFRLNVLETAKLMKRIEKNETAKRR